MKNTQLGLWGGGARGWQLRCPLENYGFRPQSQGRVEVWKTDAQSPLSRKFCSLFPGSHRCGHLLLRDKLSARYPALQILPRAKRAWRIQGPIPSLGLALAPVRGLWTRTMLKVWQAPGKSGLTARPSVCFRTPEPGTQSKGQEPAQGQERPPGLCSLLPLL